MVFFGNPVFQGDVVYCGHIQSYEEYFSIVSDAFHNGDTWFLKDAALYDDGLTRYFIVCPD